MGQKSSSSANIVEIVQIFCSEKGYKCELLSDTELIIYFPNIPIIYNYHNTTFKIRVPDSVREKQIINYYDKKKYQNINNILDILEDTDEYLKNIGGKCIICNELLEFVSNEPANCGRNDCYYSVDEIDLGDNYITDQYQDSQEVFWLIITTAYASMTSPRRLDVFEPFPSLVSNQKLERGLLSALNKVKIKKDFNIIDQFVKTFPTPENIINVIKQCENDMQLKARIGDEFYQIIKFVISSNKTSIKNTELVENNTIKQFKVIHTSEVEERFKKEGNNTCYLYHGSAMENWYSIMRNGIKVCSDTKLMTAGRAYGSGIYLSNSISFSHGYCVNRGISNYGTIMAVFELIGKRQNYIKGGNIYVCANDQNLILRYLIWYRNLPTSLISAADKIFAEKGEETKKSVINTNAVEKRMVRRLTKEITEFQTKGIEEGNGLRISVGDDMSIWKVFMSKFPEGEAITKDLNKRGIDEIELEIRFPPNYPIDPPFIRIVYPRFEYQTGHITSGGSICMDILTHQSWSPIMSMESILVQIRALILEGGGRLDAKQWNLKYDYQEAQASFRRVAMGHGWKI